MGIAFQPVKQAEAVVTNQIKQHCAAQCYAIAALTMMTILLIVYICLTTQRLLYLREDFIQIQ